MGMYIKAVLLALAVLSAAGVQAQAKKDCTGAKYGRFISLNVSRLVDTMCIERQPGKGQVEYVRWGKVAATSYYAISWPDPCHYLLTFKHENLVNAPAVFTPGDVLDVKITNVLPADSFVVLSLYKGQAITDTLVKMK